MSIEEIIYKIRTGEIDVNNQSRFFGILIKGLLVDLNSKISVRNTSVPHYIINTGNELMTQEIKGYDHSKDPIEATNENFVYTKTPRCAITPKGIQLIPDQLTSPYANGQLQLEYDEKLITLIGEVRRMPLKMNIELKYIVNTFTDALEAMQQIVTKMAFVQNFNIVYMGQSITCSYSIPDNLDEDNMIDFDESTTDDRRHSITLDIEIDTNLPIYHNESIMSADKYIKKMEFSADDPSELAYRLMVLPVGGIESGAYGEDPHAPYTKKIDI